MSTETIPQDLTTIISKETLATYTGGDKPLCVALYVSKFDKICVFDVSSRADLYGPGEGYHVFTGKDASISLATMNLHETAQYHEVKLNDEKKKVLNDWADKYMAKYPIVGVLA